MLIGLDCADLHLSSQDLQGEPSESTYSKAYPIRMELCWFG